jgi:methyltransferase (TIGR00027 family)
MEDSTASRTALAVSLIRAIHTRTDPDPLIDDDWGDRLVPDWAVDELRELALARMTPAERERAMAAPERLLDEYFPRHDMFGNGILRLRWAEEALAEAIAGGVNQYVIVGAGFDSFALRRPAFARDVEIIEIDHPATQTLKLERLRDLGIAAPPGVRFIAADFTRETMASVLSRAGLDRQAPAFFSWLGVASYLTREENIASLSAMAASAPGSLIAFTYIDQAVFEARALANAPESETLRDSSSAVARLGEPFVSGFDPKLLGGELAALGLELIEDFNGPGLAQRYGRTGARNLPSPTASRFAMARVKEP